MCRYTSGEIGCECASHQVKVQDRKNPDVKRIESLGELVFGQFCCEYLPVELWEQENEETIWRYNPESFSSYDFEVFGYEVDAETSCDVSTFPPGTLLDNDPNDDIIVMVWYRDDEGSLVLLGWECTEILKSKAASQEKYPGKAPEKLDHLATQPMSEFVSLGPNTAYMNQKSENPSSPGGRVKRKGDKDASAAVVAEVLPPEQNIGVYGVEMEGEAVSVAFPSSLDRGPGNRETTRPALCASYYYDQNIRLYICRHSDLEFAGDE